MEEQTELLMHSADASTSSSVSSQSDQDPLAVHKPHALSVIDERTEASSAKANWASLPAVPQENHFPPTSAAQSAFAGIHSPTLPLLPKLRSEARTASPTLSMRSEFPQFPTNIIPDSLQPPESPDTRTTFSRASEHLPRQSSPANSNANIISHRPPSPPGATSRPLVPTSHTAPPSFAFHDPVPAPPSGFKDLQYALFYVVPPQSFAAHATLSASELKITPMSFNPLVSSQRPQFDPVTSNVRSLLSIKTVSGMPGVQIETGFARPYGLKLIFENEAYEEVLLAFMDEQARFDWRIALTDVILERRKVKAREEKDQSEGLTPSSHLGIYAQRVHDSFDRIPSPSAATLSSVDGEARDSLRNLLSSHDSSEKTDTAGKSESSLESWVSMTGSDETNTIHSEQLHEAKSTYSTGERHPRSAAETQSSLQGGRRGSSVNSETMSSFGCPPPKSPSSVRNISDTVPKAATVSKSVLSSNILADGSFRNAYQNQDSISLTDSNSESSSSPQSRRPSLTSSPETMFYTAMEEPIFPHQKRFPSDLHLTEVIQAGPQLSSISSLSIEGVIVPPSILLEHISPHDSPAIKAITPYPSNFNVQADESSDIMLPLHNTEQLPFEQPDQPLESDQHTAEIFKHDLSRLMGYISQLDEQRNLRLVEVGKEVRNIQNEILAATEGLKTDQHRKPLLKDPYESSSDSDRTSMPRQPSPVRKGVSRREKSLNLRIESIIALCKRLSHQQSVLLDSARKTAHQELQGVEKAVGQILRAITEKSASRFFSPQASGKIRTDDKILRTLEVPHLTALRPNALDTTGPDRAIKQISSLTYPVQMLHTYNQNITMPPVPPASEVSTVREVVPYIKMPVTRKAESLVSSDISFSVANEQKASSSAPNDGGENSYSPKSQVDNRRLRIHQPDDEGSWYAPQNLSNDPRHGDINFQRPRALNNSFGRPRAFSEGFIDRGQQQFMMPYGRNNVEDYEYPHNRHNFYSEYRDPFWFAMGRNLSSNRPVTRPWIRESDRASRYPGGHSFVDHFIDRQTHMPYIPQGPIFPPDTHPGWNELLTRLRAVDTGVRSQVFSAEDTKKFVDGVQRFMDSSKRDQKITTLRDAVQALKEQVTAMQSLPVRPEGGLGNRPTSSMSGRTTQDQPLTSSMDASDESPVHRKHADPIKDFFIGKSANNRNSSSPNKNYGNVGNADDRPSEKGTMTGTKTPFGRAMTSSNVGSRPERQESKSKASTESNKPSVFNKMAGYAAAALPAIIGEGVQYEYRKHKKKENDAKKQTSEKNKSSDSQQSNDDASDSEGKNMTRVKRHDGDSSDSDENSARHRAWFPHRRQSSSNSDKKASAQRKATGDTSTTSEILNKSNRHSKPLDTQGSTVPKPEFGANAGSIVLPQDTAIFRKDEKVSKTGNARESVPIPPGSVLVFPSDTSLRREAEEPRSTSHSVVPATVTGPFPPVRTPKSQSNLLTPPSSMEQQSPQKPMITGGPFGTVKRHHTQDMTKAETIRLPKDTFLAQSQDTPVSQKARISPIGPAELRIPPGSRLVLPPGITLTREISGAPSPLTSNPDLREILRILQKITGEDAPSLSESQDPALMEEKTRAMKLRKVEDIEDAEKLRNDRKNRHDDALTQILLWVAEEKKFRNSRSSEPDNNALLEAIKQVSKDQEKLLTTVAADIIANNKSLHQQTSKLLVNNGKQLMALGARHAVDSFKKEILPEILNLLRQVGDLKEKKRALLYELGDLFHIRAKQKGDPDPSPYTGWDTVKKAPPLAASKPEAKKLDPASKLGVPAQWVKWEPIKTAAPAPPVKAAPENGPIAPVYKIPAGSAKVIAKPDDTNQAAGATSKPPPKAPSTSVNDEKPAKPEIPLNKVVPAAETVSKPKMMGGPIT